MMTETSIISEIGHDIRIEPHHCHRESRREIDHSASHATPKRAESNQRAYLTAKFIGEWIVSFALLILTGPLIIVLASLVRLTSRGPGFYAQTRLGRNGVQYQIWKLRTMVHDAEVLTGPIWASKHDGRVTPLGEFLRRTHLDELPQLWNVLRGEMSLIGPRPERPEIANRIERRLPSYRDRLEMRPGITGLAQMLVSADDPHDAQFESGKAKLAHDLFYVANASFALDLRIAICTPCHFGAAAIHAIGNSFLRPYRRIVMPANPKSVERAAARENQSSFSMFDVK
jgi:lipopolysaccharide/colanic/teichoic acid biosynthesis glycosyltransferase